MATRAFYFVLLLLACAMVLALPLLLAGCTSVRGAVREQTTVKPVTITETVGGQQVRSDVATLLAFLDEIGQPRALYWMSEHNAATTQPTARTTVNEGSETRSETGPRATGTSNVNISGDKIETQQEKADWGWIYPIAGVVALLLAAGAAWLKQYRLAAILAGLGAVLMSWAWLGPWIAGLIGAAIALALLYGIYLMTETQWRDTLPGIAKLLREGKDEEAIAALRASTPELDAAYKAAGKDTNK